MNDSTSHNSGLPELCNWRKTWIEILVFRRRPESFLQADNAKYNLPRKPSSELVLTRSVNILRSTVSEKGESVKREIKIYPYEFAREIQWENLNNPQSALLEINKIRQKIKSLARHSLDASGISDDSSGRESNQYFDSWGNAKLLLGNLVDIGEAKVEDVHFLARCALKIGLYRPADSLYQDTIKWIREEEERAWLTELRAIIKFRVANQESEQREREQQFKESEHLFHSARNQYRRSKDIARCAVFEHECTLMYSHRLRRWGSRVFWLHGYSPWCVLLSVFLVWLVCGFAFAWLGLEHDETTISWGAPASCGVELQSWWAVLGQGLYFSAVTLSTLGYGDYAPATAGAMFVATIEAILGGFVFLPMFLILAQRRYLSG